ncbi:hypothetical protein ACLKA6_015880 [Drosophila palustris]
MSFSDFHYEPSSDLQSCV